MKILNQELKMEIPIVAILGRPNVGKSSLFNRVLKRRVAIVEETPGVTRDRNYGEGEWGGRRFLLVDTGGFIPRSEEKINLRVKEQIEFAIEEADLLLFVVDGKEGPQPMDFELLERVRRSGKPTLLAVNKVDNEKGEGMISDFYSLGIGTPFPVSAIQGRGVRDLLDQVLSLLEKSEGWREDSTLNTHQSALNHVGFRAGVNPYVVHTELPRIAIIGRPNVGKSSIVNRILREERLIVDPLPGTTRDSIDTFCRLNGREVVLVDTAGLKRRSKIQENIELLSTLRTVRSLERCHVVLLVLDGTEMVSRQDKRIAQLVIKRGKGVVLAINKADRIEEGERKRVTAFYQRELSFLSSPPIHFTSAITGEGIEGALYSTLMVFEEGGKEVNPHELDEVMMKAIEVRPPPLSERGLKIESWKQRGTHPPQFHIYTNQPDSISLSYLQFLKRRLRERFGFSGVPIVVKPVRR